MAQKQASLVQEFVWPKIEKGCAGEAAGAAGMAEKEGRGIGMCNGTSLMAFGLWACVASSLLLGHSFGTECREKRLALTPWNKFNSYKIGASHFMLGVKPLSRKWGTCESRIVGARQRWTCNVCGDTLPAMYHLDHVVALWKGGSNDIETNAQVSIKYPVYLLTMRRVTLNCHCSRIGALCSVSYNQKFIRGA